MKYACTKSSVDSPTRFLELAGIYNEFKYQDIKPAFKSHTEWEYCNEILCLRPIKHIAIVYINDRASYLKIQELREVLKYNRLLPK